MLGILGGGEGAAKLISSIPTLLSSLPSGEPTHLGRMLQRSQALDLSYLQQLDSKLKQNETLLWHFFVVYL